MQGTRQVTVEQIALIVAVAVITEALQKTQHADRWHRRLNEVLSEAGFEPDDVVAAMDRVDIEGVQRAHLRIVDHH